MTRLRCDTATAVIWADDDWSDKAIARAKARDLNLITVGEKGKGIRLVSRKPTQLGQDLEIEVQGEHYKVKLPLIGAYQAANALTACGVVIASGDDVEDVIGASVAPADGARTAWNAQRSARSGAPIYVDYAHTPDGLDAAIKALRPHTNGQVDRCFWRWRRSRCR